MAVALYFALLLSSCVGSRETSFFSNFSIRGGGVGTHAGGIDFGGTRFNSHKSDSFTCRLISNEPVDFETRLFSGLELNVQQELRDNGAQITE